MGIKCLNSFHGFGEFNRFTIFLDEDNWKIEKQLLKDRVLINENKPYFKNLVKLFEQKKLSIWPLKLEEVITWCDTMSLLKRLFILLFKQGIDTDKIDIIIEYPLIYGNHMRADYLIVYDRLIIVLEFGMFNQDEKRSEERYTKKLQESINYRQIIGNIVESELKVVNYVMIYRPEFDRIKGINISDNRIYNMEEIQRLSGFIGIHLQEQDELSSIAQLERISIFN